MASSEPTVWLDPAIHDSTPTLWAALERALPLRFTTRDETTTPIGRVVVDGTESATGPPTLAVPLPEDCGDARLTDVRTTSSVPDKALAGMDLADCGPFKPGFTRREPETVLAETALGPVWLMGERAGSPTFRCARPIALLSPDDSLRSHLTLGNFLGLVPLVQALRSWLGPDGWSEPGLRATFLFDDINLHGRRYGYIPFDELVADSKEHGYHTVMATIPLDTWFSHRAAREFFSNRDVLSMVFHGNNHTNYELASPETDDQALAMMAQGLRRVRAFEQRTDLTVDRVMTPPHGRCSTRVADALFRLGFDGLCIDDVYSWSTQADPDPVLHGWFPADLVAGGLPVLPRTLFEHDPRELAFLAFLRHPLVIYGHHQDVADGLGVLRSFADLVNGFGEVRWCGLEEILETNVATRVVGSQLRARAYSRAVEFAVPDGIDEVVFETPGVAGISGSTQVHLGDGPVGFTTDDRSRLVSDTVQVSPGKVRASLSSTDPVEADSVAAPPTRPWPMVRRILTETRDRAMPLAPNTLSRLQRSS